MLDGFVALQGQEVFLTGSVGVALTEPGQDAGELLRNADVAMYAAKAAGRDRYEVFRSEMQVAALKSLDLQTARCAEPSRTRSSSFTTSRSWRWTPER